MVFHTVPDFFFFFEMLKGSNLNISGKASVELSLSGVKEYVEQETYFLINPAYISGDEISGYNLPQCKI